MEKKIFLRCTHQKCAIMDFCFLKPSQGGTKVGSPLILITYGEGKICTKFGNLFKTCTMVVLIPLTISKNKPLLYH